MRAKLAIGVGVLAVCAHAVTLANDFAYDDVSAIANNPVVQGPFDLGRLLATDYWGQPKGSPVGAGTWRPLPVLTFWVDLRLGGGKAWPFHLQNLLAHALTVVALGLALEVQLRRRRLAWTAAALFAVLTIGTEAVAGIVGRADLMAAGLTFAAWTCLGRADERVGAGRLAAGAGCLFLAFLCKESAIAFLGVVVLGDLLVAPGRPRLFPARHAALVAPALVAILFRTLAFAAPGKALAVSWNNNPLLGEPIGVRTLTALRLLVLSLRVSLVPLNLSPDYSYAEILPERSLASVDVLAGAAALLLLVACAIFVRRRHPPAVWAVLLFLVPVLSVTSIAVVMPQIFAERLLYPSAAGVALAGAWIAEEAFARGRRVAGAVFLGALALGNLTLTVLRDREWKDDMSLFEAASRVAPRSARVWVNYGQALQEHQRLAEAKAALERALVLAPDFAAAHAGYGTVLDELGERERAYRHLRVAVARAPHLRLAHYNLAVFLARHGHRAEAAEVLRAWLAGHPESPQEERLLRDLQ